MEIISDVVIYIMMAFVLIGAVAAIRDDQNGLGKEFLQGIHSIGYLFIPVAGVMAALPYLSTFIEKFLGPIWSALGADPSMAATTFIATDMGGYQLAEATAHSNGDWITAMVTGYMAGATIVFSIPVGLAMLRRVDHKYMALGIMSGILTIPIGVVVTMAIILMTKATIRSEVSTTGAASTEISGLDWASLVGNMLPLVIIVALIAIGLKVVPDIMIKIFMVFGRFIDAAVKLLLAVSIVEYFTGIFTRIFGSWGFGTIIATPDDTFRPLEVAGYVGIMLAGAFPMVYAIQKYLSRPLAAVGSKFGISETGMAGILGGTANILALFHLIKDMPAKDKVLAIAYATTGAFLLGDHLSFTANFQPNLIVPILIGKLAAAILAMVLAYMIAVPTARRLEAADLAIDDLDVDPGMAAETKDSNR
jgi:ethanolamine transporter